MKSNVAESETDFRMKFRVTQRNEWVKEDDDHQTIGDTSGKFDKGDFTTKLYTATCDAKNLRCGPVTMFYNPSLKSKGSSFFELKDVESVEENLPIEKIDFEYVTGDPAFITFLSGLKTASFIISAVFFAIYVIRLKKVPEVSRVVEQRMTFNLSILLLLYNDPFYAIIMYRPSVIK